MKKVLIVARYFGTRIPGLMKYLPECGWQPVLLAPSSPPAEPFPPGLPIITTPVQDTLHFLKRLLKISPSGDVRGGIKEKLGVSPANRILDSLLNWAGAVINYPDYDKGWRAFAVKAGNELLQKEKFDAIISSSSPVTAHVIAGALHKTANLPWLADLRDPWSQNHNYSYGAIRRWFDKQLEIKTLGKANALVIVSQPWAENLKTLHRGKTTYTVTNGFDPDLVNRAGVPLTPKFTITYTGKVYQGKQDPVRLFEAVKELIREKAVDPDKLEIRFYGLTGGWLDLEIQKYQLQSIVKMYGNISRDEALRKQQESHVLLLLNWDDPKEKGTIPSKVFEYMATLRPILATGGAPDDAIQQIIRDSGSGRFAANSGEVKKYLIQWYSEYLSTGKVAPAGDEKTMMLYSQREMARKFAEILERLIVR